MLIRLGWTLQELLAPNDVKFLDKDWNNIGTKQKWAPDLEHFTGIPELVIRQSWEYEFRPRSERLLWAARRVTTRVEDEAYCLLGLLGINMPLLYGEGKSAFARLCKEVVQQTHDPSIFNHSDHLAMIPRSVAQFLGAVRFPGPQPLVDLAGRAKMINWPARQSGFMLTNRGILVSDVYYIDLTRDDILSFSDNVRWFLHLQQGLMAVRVVLLTNGFSYGVLMSILNNNMPHWMRMSHGRCRTRFADDAELLGYLLDNGKFAKEAFLIR